QQAERDVHRVVGPVIAARNDIQYLDQRERERAVGNRPLHQLALPQTLPEFVHAGSPPESCGNDAGISSRRCRSSLGCARRECACRNLGAATPPPPPPPFFLPTPPLSPRQPRPAGVP